MKKIPNLFQKDPTDLSRVINQLNESCKWIHDGYIATQKFDGTATAIIENKLYKRYDAKLKPSTVFEIGDSVIMKNKKPFLNGNVVDIIVNIEGNMITLKDNGIIIKEYLKLIYKFLNEYQRTITESMIPCCEPDSITGHHPHWLLCDRNKPEDKYHFEAFDKLTDIEYGTYELCGEKIGNNKEKITGHKLIKHGSVIFDIDSLNYDYLKNLFSNPNIDIEGFVIYHPTDDRMCKIRKSDFGIER